MGRVDCTANSTYRGYAKGSKQDISQGQEAHAQQTICKDIGKENAIRHISSQAEYLLTYGSELTNPFDGLESTNGKSGSTSATAV